MSDRLDISFVTLATDPEAAAVVFAGEGV